MTARKLVLLLVAAVVVGVLAFVGVDHLRKYDTSAHYQYPTYADVEKDKTVKAAAIPAFVPRSATDIAGWYNVEMNEEGIEFTFDPKDIASITNNFQEARGESETGVREKIARASWKKFDMNGKLAFFQSSGQKNATKYLAVDLAQSRAFYLAMSTPNKTP